MNSLPTYYSGHIVLFAAEPIDESLHGAIADIPYTEFEDRWFLEAEDVNVHVQEHTVEIFVTMLWHSDEYDNPKKHLLEKLERIRQFFSELCVQDLQLQYNLRQYQQTAMLVKE